jgi:aspartyl-tRNA(Asn)/glutamyl-tRNA(Gln) amidotransferase subunit C
MSITREDVQHLASLARLELTPEEERDLITHLSTILQYMEKLTTLNTDGVEPMSHAVAVSSFLREDRVTNQPNPKALLQNTPAREDNFFKVPKIIE